MALRICLPGKSGNGFACDDDRLDQIDILVLLDLRETRRLGHVARLVLIKESVRAAVEQHVDLGVAHREVAVQPLLVGNDVDQHRHQTAGLDGSLLLGRSLAQRGVDPVDTAGQGEHAVGIAVDLEFEVGSESHVTRTAADVVVRIVDDRQIGIGVERERGPLQRTDVESRSLGHAVQRRIVDVVGIHGYLVVVGKSHVEPVVSLVGHHIGDPAVLGGRQFVDVALDHGIDPRIGAAVHGNDLFLATRQEHDRAEGKQYT